MTINEILQANGVATDLAGKILADMKENKIFTASQENLDTQYNQLKTEQEGLTQQLGEANTLIEELKKSNKGNEDLQTKISDYETQVNQLQSELAQTKLEAALKVALLSEKALDIDYLSFKLKEKGELALDENDKIKGWEDKIAALKTQFPSQFENTGAKKITENKLEPRGGETITQETFAKMGYLDRLKLYQENPEAYAELTKN